MAQRCGECGKQVYMITEYRKTDYCDDCLESALQLEQAYSQSPAIAFKSQRVDGRTGAGNTKTRGLTAGTHCAR